MKLKNIEVDFDDYQSLRKAFNLIKPRMVELSPEKINKPSKRAVQSKIFDSCTSILNSNIDYIYPQKDSSNNYYVYAHCDPSNAVFVSKYNTNGLQAFAATLGLTKYPIYIGKGTGNRAYQLDRSETHKKVRQSLRSRGLDLQTFIIKDNLTESEALALEAKLIDIFGLICYGGKLTNLDEGKNPKERQLNYIEHLRVLYPHDLRFKPVDELGSTDTKNSGQLD